MISTRGGDKETGPGGNPPEKLRAQGQKLDFGLLWGGILSVGAAGEKFCPRFFHPQPLFPSLALGEGEGLGSTPRSQACAQPQGVPPFPLPKRLPFTLSDCFGILGDFGGFRGILGLCPLQWGWVPLPRAAPFQPRAAPAGFRIGTLGLTPTPHAAPQLPQCLEGPKKRQKPKGKGKKQSELEGWGRGGGCGVTAPAPVEMGFVFSILSFFSQFLF